MPFPRQRRAHASSGAGHQPEDIVALWFQGPEVVLVHVIRDEDHLLWAVLHLYTRRQTQSRAWLVAAARLLMDKGLAVVVSGLTVSVVQDVALEPTVGSLWRRPALPRR